jgi:hypothetical protein
MCLNYDHNGISIEYKNQKFFWSKNQIESNTKYIKEIISLIKIKFKEKSDIKILENSNNTKKIEEGVIITNNKIKIFLENKKLIDWNKNDLSEDYTLTTQVINYIYKISENKKEELVNQIWNSFEKWQYLETSTN